MLLHLTLAVEYNLLSPCDSMFVQRLNFFLVFFYVRTTWCCWARSNTGCCWIWTVALMLKQVMNLFFFRCHSNSDPFLQSRWARTSFEVVHPYLSLGPSYTCSCSSRLSVEWKNCCWSLTKQDTKGVIKLILDTVGGRIYLPCNDLQQGGVEDWVSGRRCTWWIG